MPPARQNNCLELGELRFTQFAVFEYSKEEIERKLTTVRLDSDKTNCSPLILWSEIAFILLVIPASALSSLHHVSKSMDAHLIAALNMAARTRFTA